MLRPFCIWYIITCLFELKLVVVVVVVVEESGEEISSGFLFIYCKIKFSQYHPAANLRFAERVRGYWSRTNL